MSFIFKQPNGKLGRFSSVVDCPTHINMTEEDYINYRVEIAIEEAKRNARVELAHYIHPFTDVEESFISSNMTKDEFADAIAKMQDPDGKYEEL